MFQDTIVAISTPIGTGAIGMIRLSGPEVRSTINQLFPFKEIRPRYVNYDVLTHPITKNPIDSICWVFFERPHSYTGEDMLEINVHSGLYILRSVLALCLELGARLAQKGEFTKRAFLAGKLNLLQAESILELIEAKGEKAHQTAFNHFQGKLNNLLHNMREKLIQRSEELESSLEFPEELPPINRELFHKTIQNELNILNPLIQTQDFGQLISSGVTVVIVGKPNVGKSSLINQLAGQERAIISEIPGTTRDFLDIHVDQHGIIFEYIDTAGIHDSTHEIELLGIQKTEQLLSKAHMILWMIDQSNPITKEDQCVWDKIKNKDRIYIILNKTDLPQKADVSALPLPLTSTLALPVMSISALKNEGILELKEKLYQDITAQYHQLKDPMICNVRQITSLKKVKKDLDELQKKLQQKVSDDILAEHLKKAILNLEEVTGETITEEVLEGIFQRFCVGK